jgi:hypothetical protein
MIATFADIDAFGERIDAGERNIQIGEDASLAMRDNVLSKSCKIARSGTARIDECRHGAFARERVGRHAQRGAAPIDMRMQIDQTGRDQMTGDIVHRPAIQRFTHHRNLAVQKCNVRDTVDALRRVDHPAAP